MCDYDWFEYDPIDDREGPDDDPVWMQDADDEEMSIDADTHCVD